MPSRHFPSVDRKCANLAELWFKQHIPSNYLRSATYPLSKLYKQIQTGEIFGCPLQRVVSKTVHPRVQVVLTERQLTFKAGDIEKVIPINENSIYTTCCRLHLNFTLIRAPTTTTLTCYNDALTSFCTYTISPSIPAGEAAWDIHDPLIAWRTADSMCYVFDWRANRLLSSFSAIGKKAYDAFLLGSDFLVIQTRAEFAVYHWKEGSRLNFELPRSAYLPAYLQLPNQYGLDGEWLIAYHNSSLAVYDLSKKCCVFTKDIGRGLFTRVYRDMLFHVTLRDLSGIKAFHIPTQKLMNTIDLPGTIQRLWIDDSMMRVIINEQPSNQSVEVCLMPDVW
jgi:hypothetical protein